MAKNNILKLIVLLLGICIMVVVLKLYSVSKDKNIRAAPLKKKSTLPVEISTAENASTVTPPFSRGYISYDDQKYTFSFYMSADINSGQDIGSIFDLVDDNGKSIIGAGFENGSTTARSVNNRVISFFAATGENMRKKDMGKPFENSNFVQLMSYNNRIIAIDRKRSIKPKYYNIDTNSWLPFTLEGFDIDEKLQAIIPTSEGPIVLSSDRIQFKRKTYYSGSGFHQFIYYKRKMIILQPSSSSLYFCDWNPETPTRINLKDCLRLNIDPTINRLYCHFELDNFMYLFSNTANIYKLSLKGEITKIFDRDAKENRLSNQMYASLKYNNSVLISHYPTGSLYCFDNKKCMSLFFPAIPAISPSPHIAREAQSIALYAGKLFTGIWPWGEIWQLKHPHSDWSMCARAFNTEYSEEGNPFRKNFFKLRGRNQGAKSLDSFGQRITTLIPLGNKLYFATGNKTGDKAINTADYNFITKDIEEQYGRVGSIESPSQISAQIRLVNNTYFDFSISKTKLCIAQDGKVLCSTPITNEMFQRIKKSLSKNTRLHVGSGKYGNFEGEYLQSLWRTYK